MLCLAQTNIVSLPPYITDGPTGAFNSTSFNGNVGEGSVVDLFSSVIGNIETHFNTLPVPWFNNTFMCFNVEVDNIFNIHKVDFNSDVFKLDFCNF